MLHYYIAVHEYDAANVMRSLVQILRFHVARAATAHINFQKIKSGMFVSGSDVYGICAAIIR